MPRFDEHGGVVEVGDAIEAALTSVPITDTTAICSTVIEVSGAGSAIGSTRSIGPRTNRGASTPRMTSS
jgi:hypothetical protein